MCTTIPPSIHMLDMVRWMYDLGWPKSVSSTGGILVQKQSRSNISDTQTATFDFPEFPVVWTHRTYGASADPEYPWGATIYGDKGTLKLSVNKYEFFPLGQTKPKLSGTALFEYDKFPEDKDEKDLEKHVASAIRVHMRDLLKARETGVKPVADIEQGYISTASCILANLSMKLGRSLTWDTTKHQIANDDEANKLLKRPYRAGYTHPA
jgi:predicted dehydrogenase